jgi:hypothetical protein
MKSLTVDELRDVVEKHSKWLKSQDGGQRANLQGADLQGADLQRAIAAGLAIAQTRIIPASGSFEGWKSCVDNVLVKVLIPAEAKRSHAFGRKCRAEFVDVMEIVGDVTKAISRHDSSVTYRVGERVTCNEWCDDFTQECAGGIHFFITKEEASDYQ